MCRSTFTWLLENSRRLCWQFTSFFQALTQGGLVRPFNKWSDKVCSKAFWRDYQTNHLKSRPAFSMSFTAIIRSQVDNYSDWRDAGLDSNQEGKTLCLQARMSEMALTSCFNLVPTLLTAPPTCSQFSKKGQVSSQLCWCQSLRRPGLGDQAPSWDRSLEVRHAASLWQLMVSMLSGRQSYQRQCINDLILKLIDTWGVFHRRS